MDDYGERRGGYGGRSRGGYGGGGGGGGFRPSNNLPKPVSVGDVIDLTIEATGSRGDGIAKKDGFVIFVKGASQGQTVKAKIVSLGRSSATAEVVEGGASEPAPAATEAAPAESEPAASEEGAAAEETKEGGEEGQ